MAQLIWDKNIAQKQREFSSNMNIFFVMQKIRIEISSNQQKSRLKNMIKNETEKYPMQRFGYITQHANDKKEG